MKEGSKFSAATRAAAHACVLVLVIAGLSACGGGAPKKEGLAVSITATDDVNPDLQGRPSPIVVHIIELKSVETFNSLDYVSLTDPSGAALGADRLNGTQLVIAPGGFNMQQLEIDAATAAIGIVAGYRDIDNASWRRAVPVVPGETDTVVVSLEQFQVTTSTQN